ncbi:MAG: heavy-metal-associated domain-containing protein [Kiritimatiellales bacterium]|nr:heavy-metal-associated domain-containing protein [Kiritimatiellota bacterium]MBL7012618.1 heavy-metal-associated domain-containing protein [Kiritimatiellales bacterium]
MKKPISVLISLAALLLITACHRNDIRTEIFQIEQLRNPESVQLIAKALQPLEGIQKITPDFENHELIVVFDGRVVYVKNIEYAIVAAGFSLPNWPANPADKAKLPEELR